MKGWRPSLLEATSKCGLAGHLSAQHGAGRAAAVSKAWHAEQARADDAKALLAGLTPDERREIAEWQSPVDVVLENGVTLAYEKAGKEVSVRVADCMGMPYRPAEGDEVLTEGTLDFVWVVEVQGETWVYVGDLKRSRHTLSYDPESLQLHTYGIGAALKFEAVGYVTGVWAAIEGEWRWGQEMVRLDSDRCAEVWTRIVHAATNTENRASTGPHCADCYQRMYCPDHLLPAALDNTKLAAVTEGGELTSDTAREALEWIKVVRELADKAEDHMKALVKQGHLRVLSADGLKHWVPCESKGRESTSVKAVREAFGDEAERAIKQGPPVVSMKWCKRG